MYLELAKQQITQNHPDAPHQTQQNAFKALENLGSILDSFKSEHVEKIYEIEKINPSYFPGLSIAAAETIKDLKQGNPNLSLDFILQTVNKLAGRGRPWESLTAFSQFGKHCGHAMTEANVNYLMTINRDVLEIIGYSIQNKMSNPKDYENHSIKEDIESLKGNPDLITALNAVFSHKPPYQNPPKQNIFAHKSPVSKTSLNIQWSVLNGFIIAVGIAAVAISLVALHATGCGAIGLTVAALGYTLAGLGLWKAAQPKESPPDSLKLNPTF